MAARSLTPDQAIKQLRKFCGRVECNGLGKRDRDQVQKFLQLRKSALPEPEETSKAAIFRRFLHYAETICKLEGSAICVVGLGKTSIVEMSSANRTQLPLQMKQAGLQCPALRLLVEQNSQEGQSSHYSSKLTILKHREFHQSLVRRRPPRPHTQSPVRRRPLRPHPFRPMFRSLFQPNPLQ